MASNDFTIDLVEKLAEEQIEYLLITVQKGKTEHKSNAYFNVTTVEGADMIMTTVEQVFNNIDETEAPDDIEIDWSDRDDDDESDFKEGAD
jgi:hypothetical protein